jgi:hypothetical protein
MGLDRDDLIVRRRVAQKLTFVVQDTSDLAQRTDQDLRLIYEANPNRFQTPARVSFPQIYFRASPENAFFPLGTRCKTMQCVHLRLKALFGNVVII